MSDEVQSIKCSAYRNTTRGVDWVSAGQQMGHQSLTIRVGVGGVCVLMAELRIIWSGGLNINFHHPQQKYKSCL